MADYKSTGGKGKFDPTPGGPITSEKGSGASSNLIDQARQLTQFNIAQAQPQIQSLQAQKGESSQAFTEAKTNLKNRYDQLVSQITGRSERELKKTDIVSARELGRRGIPLSSTSASEYQGEKRATIEENLASILAQIQQQEAEGMTGLTTASTSEQRALQNAISQLQSGRSLESAGLALQNIQGQRQQALSQAQMSQQQQQFQAGQAFDEKQLQQNQAQFEAQQARLSSNSAKTTTSEKRTQIGQVVNQAGNRAGALQKGQELVNQGHDPILVRNVVDTQFPYVSPQDQLKNREAYLELQGLDGSDSGPDQGWFINLLSGLNPFD
ncbi:MAG: hypothetical protein GY858_05545 [Candidatus Omnitrophica bacterium]|nr:hypothetical protein [Candidatus Omnitrophota bacterium]